MLARQLRRAVLDGRAVLPPTFLCPWTATLTTEAHTSSSYEPPPPIPSSPARSTTAVPPQTPSQTPLPKSSRLPSPPSHPGPSSTTAPKLHDSVTTLLPILRAQRQIYATIHIHAKSYLITEGDTIRLPFLMKGVEPGDLLRLNRAINLGSRDFTLRAPARERRGKSTTASTEIVLDPTPGSSLASMGARMKGARPTAAVTQADGETSAPEEVFVPHMLRGQIPYLDERLFTCRAVVLGEESEPMRIAEKTKRRQRHIKHVWSKHKYTLLKIKELSVNSVEDVEGAVEDSQSLAASI